MTALLAAIGALAAGLVLLRVSEWGGAAAGGSDAVTYVTAARNLLEGNGFTAYGVPYQGLAPLFPLALAGIGLFGPDPLVAAGWLNAAAFGLTAFATAAWVRSRTRSGFLAVWAGLACAFSVQLARIVSPAMSEALFVMFAVLSLYALDRWLDAVAGDGDDRRRTSLLLTAAACAALACATRYLGLALVLGALPLVLLADGRGLRPTRRGIADAALFAAAALPPLGAWMLRGLLTAGSATGSFYPTGWDTSAAADVLTGGIARQALGERGFALLGELAAALPYGGDGGAIALRAAAVLALAGGAAASLPLLSRRERRGLAVPAAFAAAYAPAMLFLNWLLDFELPARYLAPLYPPLLVAAAIVLGGLLRRASERGPLVRSVVRGGGASAPALALAAVLVLWLPQQAAASYADAREHSADGLWFSARRWAESGTARYLSAIRPQDPVWSNHRIALGLFSDLPAARALFSDPAAAAAAAADAHASGEDAWIVWFHDAGDWPPYGVAALAAQPGVEAVAILEDGAVLRGDPGAPGAALAGRLLDGARLLAPARFGVHLDEARNRLVYVREACAEGDTDAGFFLRVQRPAGSGDLGFAFAGHGFREGGRCLAVRNFPYRVASFVTGQWTPERGDLWSVRVPWTGEFRDEEFAGAWLARFGALAAREADARRAGFALHAEGRTLTFVREECSAADVADRFFVHVYASGGREARDLWFRVPGGRAGLGFWFRERGLRLGGRCMASVELPEYAIARVVTGQYDASGHLWEQELRAFEWRR